MDDSGEWVVVESEWLWEAGDGRRSQAVNGPVVRARPNVLESIERAQVDRRGAIHRGESLRYNPWQIVGVACAGFFVED